MLKFFSFLSNSGITEKGPLSAEPEILPLTILTRDEINECINYEVSRRVLFQNPKRISPIINEVTDELLKKAAQIIFDAQSGSAALLQRKLKLGYTRAGHIMKQLELCGFVDPFDGNKNRIINIGTQEELKMFFETGEVITERQKLFRKKYLIKYTDHIESEVDALLIKRDRDIQEKEISKIKSEILQAENERKESKRIKDLHDQARQQLFEEGLLEKIENGRISIPRDVQNAVWNRDGGKCVDCESKESLEFDHIIPVSRGGANTIRNLQLLCMKCNRKKSNRIG